VAPVPQVQALVPQVQEPALTKNQVQVPRKVQEAVLRVEAVLLAQVQEVEQGPGLEQALVQVAELELVAEPEQVIN
jgi:hypothetical protein